MVFALRLRSGSNIDLMKGGEGKGLRPFPSPPTVFSLNAFPERSRRDFFEFLFNIYKVL
jgi:hypothetical protein